MLFPICEEAGQHYLDSVLNEPVYMGAYTLKECREMGIGLGLDLKGGMNVILEVSVPEVVKALADHKTDPVFNQAIENARKASVNDRSGFINLFVKEYKTLAPDASLAELFATQQLKGKVNTKSTDSEVVAVLREEVKSAIANSYNVLRNRIDRFGVVQPNIQSVKGEEGRIMVEMPGIKEPDRVRKLLQGSANLEFWETYNTSEIVPFLSSLDNALAATAAAVASCRGGDGSCPHVPSLGQSGVGEGCDGQFQPPHPPGIVSDDRVHRQYQHPFPP